MPNARRTIWPCLIAAASLLVGCGTPPRTAQKQTAAAPPPADTLPGEVRGKGWHIPWIARDPKHPNQPPVPVLTADAATGTLNKLGEDAVAQLQQVRVKLYQKGVYAADITAPRMTANQRDRVLVATGGVTLLSVGKETETTLTADKATWNTRSAQVVAVGNAHAVRRSKSGAVLGETSNNRLRYDTAKDEIIAD